MKWFKQNQKIIVMHSNFLFMWSYIATQNITFCDMFKAVH